MGERPIETGKLRREFQPLSGSAQFEFREFNQILTAEDCYDRASLLAETLRERSALHPVILVLGGHSGVGKTTLAEEISALAGMVHIQSDAVRKHLCRIPVLQEAPARIYNPVVSRATFTGMLQRALPLLQQGVPVVLDGAYMAPYQREEVDKVGRQYDIPCIGVWCRTDVAIQKTRILGRKKTISDAGTEIAENMAKTHDNIVPRQWMALDTTPPLEKITAQLLTALAPFRK